jgi:hypothetical protein
MLCAKPWIHLERGLQVSSLKPSLTRKVNLDISCLEFKNNTEIGHRVNSRISHSPLRKTYPGYAGYCDIGKGGLSSSLRWLGLEGDSSEALGQTVSLRYRIDDDGGIGWCDGRGGIKVY